MWQTLLIIESKSLMLNPIDIDDSELTINVSLNKYQTSELILRFILGVEVIWNDFDKI